MADSRRGGIEKIAHLFIAGHGASALRARDNSPRHWAAPASPPAGGPGQTTGGQPIPPAPQQAAAEHPNDRAAGAEALPEGLAGEPIPAPETAPAGEVPANPTDNPVAAPKPEVSPDLQALLARAKVVAVLTGHMGPLAGPAAEAIARGLAREHTRVAMLYGPAEYACLHQFTSGPAGEIGGAGGNGTGQNSSGQWPVVGGQSNGNGPNGNGHGSGGAAGSQPGAAVPHHGNGNGHPLRKRVIRSCDMLLLPDWVFQFDLWPAGRPVWSIALGYGAGSEGLMAAYGALKGLISRFGRPDEVLILPFGCNEQEEAWGGERLIEMCRRFLDIVPRTLGEAHPELRVQGGPLQPIAGGVDGIKELLESIGKVRLAVIKHPKVEPAESTEPQEPAVRFEAAQMHDPAEPSEPAYRPEPVETCEAADAADVTVLVPVDGVPRDGQDVLQAMLKHYGIGEGAFFDVWRRSSVCGTIVGSEGLIGSVGATGDLLAFALWMCRQAQIGEIDELSSITIAVREPDEWLIDAAEAMPVPVTWLRWHPYQIADRYGLLFGAIKTHLND